jgi:hypothetical protein
LDFHGVLVFNTVGSNDLTPQVEVAVRIRLGVSHGNQHHVRLRRVGYGRIELNGGIPFPSASRQVRKIAKQRVPVGAPNGAPKDQQNS